MKISAVCGLILISVSTANADGWSTTEITPLSRDSYSYERWDWEHGLSFGEIRPSISGGYELEEFGTDGYRYKEFEVDRHGRGVEINTWDW